MGTDITIADSYHQALEQGKCPARSLGGVLCQKKKGHRDKEHSGKIEIGPGISSWPDEYGLIQGDGSTKAGWLREKLNLGDM